MANGPPRAARTADERRRKPADPCSVLPWRGADGHRAQPGGRLGEFHARGEGDGALLFCGRGRRLVSAGFPVASLRGATASGGGRVPCLRER